MDLQLKSRAKQDFPSPRLTAWGYAAIGIYLVAPFLGTLTVADIILYLIFRYGLDMCYGVWCWF